MLSTTDCSGFVSVDEWLDWSYLYITRERLCSVSDCAHIAIPTLMRASSRRLEVYLIFPVMCHSCTDVSSRRLRITNSITILVEKNLFGVVTELRCVVRSARTDPQPRASRRIN